jgi:hypothetical protein
MMLKAQRIDPDTGDYTDCDGDNAYGYLHLDSVSNTNVAAESSRVDDDLCITLDGDSIKTLAYEEAIKHSLLSQRRS